MIALHKSLLNVARNIKLTEHEKYLLRWVRNTLKKQAANDLYVLSFVNTNLTKYEMETEDYQRTWLLYIINSICTVAHEQVSKGKMTRVQAERLNNRAVKLYNKLAKYWGREEHWINE